MIVALGAASSLTSSAAAQQEFPPHSFFGTALIDGRPPPAGTLISAIVDGVRVNSAIVDSSGVFFDIQAFSAGKEVSFTIGELIAKVNISRKGINQAEMVTAEVGGADLVELTASETSFNRQAITYRQILFDLYYATQGVNWRNSTNWLSRKPLGTWHGVTTGPGGCDRAPPEQQQAERQHSLGIG